MNERNLSEGQWEDRKQWSLGVGQRRKNVLNPTYTCTVGRMWNGKGRWFYCRHGHWGNCYLLTYLLTPSSRFLEKLTGSAASQRNSPHFWNPKVHHRTHKCPPPVPILSQLHPVPTTPSHFLKIHLNIILPSTSGSPQWSLSLRFSHQNPVHPLPLPFPNEIKLNIAQELKSFLEKPKTTKEE